MKFKFRNMSATGTSGAMNRPAAPAEALAALLEQIRQKHAALAPACAGHADRPEHGRAGEGVALKVHGQARPGAPAAGAAPCRAPETWPAHGTQLQDRLEGFGLLPTFANAVARQVSRRLAPRSSPSAAEELAAVVAVLSNRWRRPTAAPAATQWHVFVGAPGSGKTTVLAKWLAQTVLLADCRAQVWRLDGLTANTAESLSVLAEVFGVPLRRAWPEDDRAEDGGVHFVDLPGVDWQDAGAVESLRRRVEQIPQAQIHLVLNAAYEASGVLAQIGAFAEWPVANLIFTHLDEEPRWGKLWNVVLGTPFAIGFLSAGQNVPGDFHAASVDRFLPGGWAADGAWEVQSAKLKGQEKSEGQSVRFQEGQ